MASDNLTAFDAAIGKEMYSFITDLYPICRSITGNGVRETLKMIQSQVPLEIHEVPTGTHVFDWTVPKEWNIRDAYIKNSRGEKIVDFQRSNLHVVNYSIPVRQTMSLAELKPHLHSLPDHPDWIPYRTSYYKEDWGFCLGHNQLLQMPDQAYEVVIDSTLENGFLTYGECFFPGQSTDEVLFSCHVCHPSLANDNLSGIALATFLAKYLSLRPLHYSYRILFIPGTIGAITWLALNEDMIERIKHGLVIACAGDCGKFSYKRSRRGNAEIDRVVEHVLKHSNLVYQIRDFSPYGYDERQYCSPGFNLQVGSLTRTPHGEYPEYHSSADNLDIVHADSLAQSYAIYSTIVKVIENNATYVNQNPKCEPQLGRRGLYSALGGQKQQAMQMAMLWVINFSDGNHSLLDIAEKSDTEFGILLKIVDILLEHNLLKKHPVSRRSNK
jgi:aminopeptidase-like protein